MTTKHEIEAPLLPSDVDIDGMGKADLMKVVQSHGLPVNDKMTAKELRPWARAVVHGALKIRDEHAVGTGTPPADGEPEPEAEPVAADAAPVVDAPVDAAAAVNVDTVELEVAPRHTIPEITTWERIQAMAQYLFKSSLRPKGLTNEWDVGLVLLAAYDLGIPSSFAMQRIHVQNGRLGMMGELMSALILRDGHRLRADVTNDHTVARVWGKRDGDDEWTWAEFTIDDAISAGLVNRTAEGLIQARSSDNKKLPWELYTGDMLYWRALARLARRHFSDCLGGISFTPDELGWGIDAEAADELEAGGTAKPYGRAGEPEPTMTLGQQRKELGSRLAAFPEDIQAGIKAEWAKRGFPPVRDLSVAAIRAVRGWVEAAEIEVERREAEETARIPDADVVHEEESQDPPTALGGEDGIEGSAVADRAVTEPSPVEEVADGTSRDDAHEPDGPGDVPGDGPVGAGHGADDEPGTDPQTATPSGQRGPADDDPDALVCASCAEQITEVPVIIPTDVGAAKGLLLPYHGDCAPFREKST